MKTPLKKYLGGAAALCLMLTACGELTREDAVEDLVELGITEETANCVMDDLESEGIEASELEDSKITPETEGVLAEAMTACLTGGDISGVLSEEEVRSSFVEGLTADGTLNQEQGECIYDHMISNGVTVDQMTSGADLEGPVQDAVTACA